MTSRDQVTPNRLHDPLDQSEPKSRPMRSGFNKKVPNIKLNEQIELYDCISEFFKTDTLDSHNKYYCHKCENLTIAQMRFRVKQLPRILIIHMKRFTPYGTRIGNALNFDEEI
jgi:ubiquitin C-terminal hydrolase